MSESGDALGRLEHTLGTLLRGGVLLSTVTLAAGLGLWFLIPDRLEPAWLLRTGLFALMATPVVRVGVSLVAYVRMRDWFFVATTAVVLLELALAVSTALHRRGN